MGFNEATDRAGILDSCRDLMRFQAMFSHHFASAPVARFGDTGRAAMLAALRRYGAYRAGITRGNVERTGALLTVASALAHWDMADIHLLSAADPEAVVGSDHSVMMTLQDCGEWERWRDYPDGVDDARLYYEGVLPAIAAGLGFTVEFDLGALDLVSPWRVNWSTPRRASGDASYPISSAILPDDTALMALMALTRQTSVNNGALYYFCADEETKRFDMVGERALREHCQNLGIERANRQKSAHLAAGWDLNLKTLMENWDGQLVSLWQFDPGILTEGVWHQDCTACPYADVWGEFGERALDLGYLYDNEMHSTYFREYHPDMLVQFAAIKTRGDATCQFRVSMPSRMRAGEPIFGGYTGGDV